MHILELKGLEQIFESNILFMELILCGKRYNRIDARLLYSLMLSALNLLLQQRDDEQSMMYLAKKMG